MLRVNKSLQALCRIFWVTTVFCLLTSTLTFAAEEQPIRVTSDKLAYDASGRTVTFTGNVHVIHPDGTLDAKKVTLTLSADSAKTSKKDSNSPVDPGKLEKITALDDVFVKMNKGQTGSCQKAVYLIAEGKLTMTGNPVLTDGENSVRGKTVNFYVKENRSEVIGAGDKRVEAVFAAPKRSKD